MFGRRPGHWTILAFFPSAGADRDGALLCADLSPESRIFLGFARVCLGIRLGILGRKYAVKNPRRNRNADERGTAAGIGIEDPLQTVHYFVNVETVKAQLKGLRRHAERELGMRYCV